MIEQIGIVVFGLVAIALTQYPDQYVQSWAPVFGLLSQPFWYVATYKAKQWGMFTLNIAYFVIWFAGFMHQKELIWETLGKFLNLA